MTPQEILGASWGSGVATVSFWTRQAPQNALRALRGFSTVLHSPPTALHSPSSVLHASSTAPQSVPTALHSPSSGPQRSSSVLHGSSTVLHVSSPALHVSRQETRATSPAPHRSPPVPQETSSAPRRSTTLLFYNASHKGGAKRRGLPSRFGVRLKSALGTISLGSGRKVYGRGWDRRSSGRGRGRLGRA